jgi:hypothetical protein
MECLNRVGIILNFLAGFMIAPELIGLDRIRRFENAMEKIARSWIKVIDPYYERFIKRFFKTNRKKALFYVFTCIVTVLLGVVFANESYIRLMQRMVYVLVGWMVFNWVASLIVFVIASVLFWVLSYVSFQRNKELRDGDPKEREYHPLAVFLVPITWFPFSLRIFC